MNGYQITFYTQQKRRHQGKSLADWLIDCAKDVGVQGATLVAATEGFGKSGRLHSARFFEFSDQPLEIIIAASSAQAESLFERLNAEPVSLFYVKTPVEFGVIGGGAAPAEGAFTDPSTSGGATADDQDNATGAPAT